MFKTLQWEDWLGIAVGAWMLASPWTLGYSGDMAATTNALFAGTLLVFAELLNLDMHADVEEWFDIVVGLWIVASPFVLGFDANRAAVFNAGAVGLVTIALAAVALSPLDRQVGRWWHGRVTPSH